MPISYPLTPPATPGWSRFVWRPRHSVAVDVNDFTLDILAYDWGGRTRFVDLALPPMTRAQYEPWAAFFLSLKGPFGTFRAGPPPGYATPRGIGTGTPLIAGAGQTGEDIATDGWTISQTGILKAGDPVEFEARLYRQLVDVNSNAGGQATLTLWPAVKVAPADNAAITVTNPKGTFRLTEDVPEELEPALMRGFSFTAIEDRR
jgi:hypothetical protein